MKVDPKTAADVLKTFIQEDRTEARIYRGRVQSVTYSLVVASFAISAFLIGNVKSINAAQLRSITLLMDLGLMAVMVLFFWRLKVDLYALRKAMKARQDLLSGLDEKDIQEINPFLPGEKVDITDSDLYWVFGLSMAVLLVKMSVIAANAACFVAMRGSP